MPRSLGPRWSKDNAKLSLESVAVSWTVQALRDEGFAVDEGWSPDRSEVRLPSRTRRPDWVCRVDGVETVIEHTRFLTYQRGTKWARLSREHRNDPTKLGPLLAVADDASDAEFDAFLEERIARKGDQHAGWGRGVLAITHNLDQDPARLAAAIERRGGEVPWWRVYWIERRPPAVLVWQSQE